jgi:hypothetical protein
MARSGKGNTLEQARRYRHRYPEKMAARRRRTRDEGRALVDARKAEGCSRCGRHFPPVAMDLHHRDADAKEANIARLVRDMRLAVLRGELEKCDVLCACCHRIVEAEGRQA